MHSLDIVGFLFACASYCYEQVVLSATGGLVPTERLVPTEGLVPTGENSAICGEQCRLG
jgi:hypothetical protein